MQKHKKQEEFCLPDDVWELIINALGPNHLHITSLTSKRFLSISNRLVTSLKICGNSLPSCQGLTLPKLLKRFNHVKKIIISQCLSTQQLNTITVDIARSGVDLEELEIVNQFDYLWSARLDGDTETWDSLSGSTIAVDGLRELGYAMTRLRVLSLGSCPALTLNELVFIADCFPHLEEFEGWDRSLNRGEFLKYHDKIDYILARKFKGLRKVELSPSSIISDIGLVNLSRSWFQLHEFILHGSEFITPKGIRALLRNSPNLVSLQLSLYEDANDLSSSDIGDSISCAKSLRDLHFKLMLVSDTMLISISKADLPLRKFSLQSCEGFTYEGLSSLLFKHQRITHLELSGVRFLDDELMNDLSAHMRHLIYVEVSAGNENLTLSVIPTFVMNCPVLAGMSLRQLSVRRGITGQPIPMVLWMSYNIQTLHLRDVRIQNVLTAVLAFPNLQELSVYNDGLKFDNDERIEDILRSCCKLKRVDVKGLGVLRSDSDIYSLTLESLDISSSHMSDEELEAIAIRCPQLLHLGIRCENITSTALKKVLQFCRMIEEITVHICRKVDFRILYELINSHPALRKVTVPMRFLPNEEQHKSFLNNGCIISGGEP